MRLGIWRCYVSECLWKLHSTTTGRVSCAYILRVGNVAHNYYLKYSWIYKSRVEWFGQQVIKMWWAMSFPVDWHVNILHILGCMQGRYVQCHVLKHERSIETTIPTIVGKVALKLKQCTRQHLHSYCTQSRIQRNLHRSSFSGGRIFIAWPLTYIVWFFVWVKGRAIITYAHVGERLDWLQCTLSLRFRTDSYMYSPDATACD